MPSLTEIQDRAEARVWPLHEGMNSVGRMRGNMIMIADPRVSRQHFSIDVRGRRATLINHSQTQGTFVNGMRIEHSIQIEHNDQIRVGNTVLTYSDRNAGERRGVSIGGNEDSFEEISVAEPIVNRNEDFSAVADPRSTEVQQIADARIGAERLNKLSGQLVLVQEIARQLSAQLDLKSLFQLILEKIFDLMRVDTGTMLLFDPARSRVTPAVVRMRDGKNRPDELKISRTMVQFAVRNRVSVLSSDTQHDERFQQQESIMAHGIRSAMCVPMIYGEEIFGVIYVDNVITDYAFTKEDLNLLTILANQAAVAVRNAKLHRQIVAEETKRANLSRFLTPALVEQIARGEVKIGLGGEIVRCAILISDIRGFTELSEKMAPAKVVAMLNAYFTEMTELIFQYRGTLDKYVGDEIIAAFGSPAPDENACRNALLCAAAMQERLREMTFDGPSVRVGVGLHYGDVIHGNVGSEQIMQYTVIGDTVNTASRLCGLAKPGQILMTRGFYDRISDSVDVRRHEPVRVKGKAEPLEIFEFTSARKNLESTPLPE